MSFYWQNGRRIKRRGKDSMMGLAGSACDDLPDDIILCSNKVNTVQKAATQALKIKGSSRSADRMHCRNVNQDDLRKNEGSPSLENLIKRTQNNHYTSFAKKYVGNFERSNNSSSIYNFFGEFSRNFSKLQEAFRDSTRTLLDKCDKRDKKSSSNAQNITFFDVSSSRNVTNEDETDFWCRDIAITRPPSYNEYNQYYIKPSEIEKRLKQIIREIDNGSLDSFNIKGDDSDSETDSKPGSILSSY